MGTLTSVEHQLLATKLFVPVASHRLVPRSRLQTLLQKSLQRPLTLLSAPPGFGKTTALATWVASLPTNDPQVAWVSLDEEDNDPVQFWTLLLTSLDQTDAHPFQDLLPFLHSSPPPAFKTLVILLLNTLLEQAMSFLLVLDDYHMVSEPQINQSLAYLLEHQPPNLHVILSTRADPPLPLSRLRVRGRVLEVRTDQLRCDVAEIGVFFQQVVGTILPKQTIWTLSQRLEGWMAGLQLLGLSWHEHADPVSLLADASGNQRDILDYLTEEVLGRQIPEIQDFLLRTSILAHLSASLCDAVLQRQGSQQVLDYLERANLFVVALDGKRQWYRYHTLFAETLRTHLEQRDEEQVKLLHLRASHWYAEHGQTTLAILHAFHAKAWPRVADLIERLPLMSLAWGVGEQELLQLWHWLERMPVEVVGSRPRLYLACVQMLWLLVPQTVLDAWFDTAEATLTAALTTPTPEDASPTLLIPQAQQEQENLLGEVLAIRAILRSFQDDAEAALPICQRALALLFPQNLVARARVACAQIHATYFSSINDATVAIEHGLQVLSLTQAAGQAALALGFVANTTSVVMIGAGRLHEAQRQLQQAILSGRQIAGPMSSEASYPSLFQAEILREWNQLDEALTLAEEAVSLCKQTPALASPANFLYGYAVLLRIFLSRGELDAARSALQQFAHHSRNLNQFSALHLCSIFTIIDHVRLWLACGDLDQARHWAETLEMGERHGTAFAREREEVACIRILLAQKQPTRALERLGPVLVRVCTARRWGHAIEIRLLQALAYQMRQEETQALDVLSEAVRLAEPEGYIRSFVDEGAPMAALIFHLRAEQQPPGLTPYLDTLLAAFGPEQQRPAKEQGLVKKPSRAQPLVEPLSGRELEVLQLLVQGHSNQEIAHELVIVVDTVKRHVSQILAKLGVQNRVQAVLRAQELGLLSEEPEAPDPDD